MNLSQAQERHDKSLPRDENARRREPSELFLHYPTGERETRLYEQVTAQAKEKFTYRLYVDGILFREFPTDWIGVEDAQRKFVERYGNSKAISDATDDAMWSISRNHKQVFENLLREGTDHTELGRFFQAKVDAAFVQKIVDDAEGDES